MMEASVNMCTHHFEIPVGDLDKPWPLTTLANTVKKRCVASGREKVPEVLQSCKAKKVNA